MEAFTSFLSSLFPCSLLFSSCSALCSLLSALCSLLSALLFFPYLLPLTSYPPPIYTTKIQPRFIIAKCVPCISTSEMKIIWPNVLLNRYFGYLCPCQPLEMHASAWPIPGFRRVRKRGSRPCFILRTFGVARIVTRSGTDRGVSSPRCLRRVGETA